MKTTIEEAFVQLQENLPSLEKMIKEIFNVDMKLSAEIELNRYSTNIRIFSEDLISQLGDTLVHRLFKSINFETWGGSQVFFDEGEKANLIWFNPKLSYEHPNGGCNGVDFTDGGIYFNTDNSTWILRMRTKEGNLELIHQKV